MGMWTSNLRSDQFEWETLVDPAAMAEKERVQLEAIAEPALQQVMRDLHTLFPPKLGESSTDQLKEGDEIVIARFCEFMKGGACKESFTDLVDCLEREKISTTCGAKMPKLIKCMDDQSDYYQSIITLAESHAEQAGKKIEALTISEMDAARKPAKRWLKRFW